MVMAIPHNSKCRYGERGAADAKPKAQIILDAAKVSAASGGNSEPKQGQRSQSARGFCPRSTMRVPQPDIIEHFGNADAVPQLPERCLSRKAGIVRCCLIMFFILPLSAGIQENAMKKQASTLLPALLDLLRQYLALDMAVYAGHATLLLLTASLPLLMWVLVIINMLPFYSVSDIAALVAQLLPDIPAIQSMAVDVIANLNDQSTIFMASFAAITTVISASGGMAAVQKGLQKLTPGARKTMFDRLWAVLYTFLFEGLMLVAMVVQSLSPILRGLAGLLPLHTLVGGLLQRLHSLLSISAVLSLALSLLTVTLIYTYVPGGKRRIRDQLPGAAAVVAVWTLFSKIFSFYIGHFWKLSYIYGSLAAIVLITLWLNVNINVLFLGAGLNAKIQGMGQEKKEPDA